MYQISYVILDVKCESQYPLVQATNLALHSSLFRLAEVFLRLGEEETETILMSYANVIHSFACPCTIARASRRRLTSDSIAFATETLRACPRP